MLRAQDAPTDKAALLKELDKIEEQRKDQMTGGLTTILNELTSAMNNPSDAVDLYQKAVFANQFEGVKRDESEFKKWKLQDADKMRDPAFVATLQLHIEYLILTLRKVGGQDTSTIVADLVAFVQKTRRLEDNFVMGDTSDGEKTADGKPVEKKYYDEFLHHSLNEGPFVKYYQIERQLDKLKDWELTPMNSRGIEDKTIFPEYRSKKDKTLLTLWDQRIEYEKEMVLKSNLSGDKTRFDNDTYPGMLWDKSRDQIAVGDETGGIQEMMTILRTYPLNASFNDWMKEMRDILNPKPN